MPFDSIHPAPDGDRAAAAPPEHGGGPRRIVVNIEIVDRRRQPPRGYSRGTFTLWLLALLLLASLAHAQPTYWDSYERDGTTYYSGTDAKGGHWTGKSYLHWGMRFFEFTGPDGETQHCRSYERPGARHAECFP